MWQWNDRELTEWWIVKPTNAHKVLVEGRCQVCYKGSYCHAISPVVLDVVNSQLHLIWWQQLLNHSNIANMYGVTTGRRLLVESILINQSLHIQIIPWVSTWRKYHSTSYCYIYHKDILCRYLTVKKLRYVLCNTVMNNLKKPTDVRCNLRNLEFCWGPEVAVLYGYFP